MSTKIEINCQPYNTLPEQVDENQKNIKTIADAINEIIDNNALLDLSHYTEDSTLTDEEFAKLPTSYVVYNIGNEKAIFTYKGEDNNVYYFICIGVSNTGLINHAFVVDKLTKSFELTSTTTSFQPLLVSGTNIKTINNESILGVGNISIEAPQYTGGEGITIENGVISVNYPNGDEEAY